MSLKERAEFLQFATETAYLAGRKTLGYFQTDLDVKYKSDDSPVTIADREAEQLIRSRIEKKYRSHAIVGEELGVVETAGATHRWFIDPIDGTKSFMRGVPLYAVLLALEVDGVVDVGAVYFPALNEMIVAATDLGCWWNGRRTFVSKTDQFDHAIVSMTNAANFAPHQREDAWQRLQKNAYYCPGWGDAYGHALVATGRVELMVDPIMNVWDCAPFPPILKEAGGYFGDWQGKETIYGGEALSSNSALLPAVLELLND